MAQTKDISIFYLQWYHLRRLKIPHAHFSYKFKFSSILLFLPKDLLISVLAYDCWQWIFSLFLKIFILLSLVKDSFICYNDSKITFFPLSTLRCLTTDICHSFWQYFKFTVCNITFSFTSFVIFCLCWFFSNWKIMWTCYLFVLLF